MRRIRIVTVVLAALSLVNFIVGGILGFVLIKGEEIKIFSFLFFIFLAVAIVSLLADWFTLRQAEAETPYRVLTLKKGRFVREQRRMERDSDGLQALQMGISGWAFSLSVPLLAFGLIWPDTFWLLSFDVILTCIMGTVVLSGLIIGIIRYRREKGGDV